MNEKSNVIEEVKTILNKAENVEVIVIKRGQSISESTAKFVSSSESSSPEEQALRETLSIASKSANTLSKTAEQVLEIKKKKETAATTVHTGQAREWLLKRLDLESRVIKARMILEHHEQELASIQ